MDKINKVLQKLAEKERTAIKDILFKLIKGETSSFNIKKLKGRDDIFRIRKGNLRIIYRFNDKKQIYILAIERKNENTYKNL